MSDINNSEEFDVAQLLNETGKALQANQAICSNLEQLLKEDAEDALDFLTDLTKATAHVKSYPEVEIPRALAIYETLLVNIQNRPAGDSIESVVVGIAELQLHLLGLENTMHKKLIECGTGIDSSLLTEGNWGVGSFTT